MVVTIDGPAASGKSTAARQLAARLDIAYLDTGAMYRALAYQVLQEDVSLDDSSAMLEIAGRLDMKVDCGPRHTRVRIDARDVTAAIRSMAVSRAAAAVAAVQPIRELLVDRQRAIGKSLGSFVSEGRDQGNVVFADADVKFVLEAAAERRAHRRLEELRADGKEVSFAEVLADVKRRDAGDAVQWAPLLSTGAAIRVDTTDMSITEVVDVLESHVRRQVGEQSPKA